MVDNNAYDEVADISQKRPHVVILGAGASYAAFPNGDRNGRKLPVMANLVKVLSLGELFEKNNVNYENVNFETLYIQLHDKPEYKDLLKEVEKKVYEYFSMLELPDYPTLYDHLIMSLRSKDVIATFNWDPFLVDAGNRNYHKVNSLPKTFFLHGNVRIGVDLETKKKGTVGAVCRETGRKFKPSQLLFPIENKNYAQDEFINAEWNSLKNYLKSAYVVTIFGYGAPKSDVEAVALLKEAWGDVEKRQFEEVEIIDIRAEEELRKLWDDFIHTHHYQVHPSFYDTIIANHPRRTCEATWTRLMEAQFIDQHPIPKNLDFDSLYDWIQPRLLEELNQSKGN